MCIIVCTITISYHYYHYYYHYCYLCLVVVVVVIYIEILLAKRRSFFFDSEELLLFRMELPCVVLWRREALDCRVLLPPEAWNLLTHNPPSLRFEAQTSCI